MNTAIICIGTELLRGFLNTNNAYLGAELEKIGCAPMLELSVDDDEKHIENAFRYALSHADCVIATGGLGPTFDDITREAVASVLGKQLVYNDTVMQCILAYCTERSIAYTDNSKRMASILDTATVLHNTHGTAPGQLLDISYNNAKKIIVLLPGPPFEMKPMFEKHVAPYLRSHCSTIIVKNVVLKTAGMPESYVEARIKPIIDVERKLEGNDLRFAILANPEGVQVKILAQGNDEVLLDERVHKIRQELCDVLGDAVFGEGDDTLEGVVGAMLTKKKKTIAIAESCTGGLISNRITNVPGSSRYFLGGIVAYSNDAKIKYLGVNASLITQHGAVSGEVATAMAQGIRAKSGATLGLAVTGIAGPTGNTDEGPKPLGLVYIALADEKKTILHKHVFKGDRATIKMRTATTALDIVRRN